MSMPPVHPAAELFPMMSEEELKALSEDIKANGQIHPVVYFGGRILDGRNRWMACSMAGIKPKETVYGGDSPTAYALSANNSRRHLTPIQKAAAAADAIPMFEAEAAARMRAGRKDPGSKPSPGLSRDESKRAAAQAAKAAGAGVKATQQMAAVKKKAPKVFSAVKKGKIKTVADAKRVAELPEDRREVALAHIDNGESVANAVAQSSEMEKAAAEVKSALDAFDKAAKALDRAAGKLEGVLSRHGASIGGVQVQQVRSTVLLAGQRIDDLISKMDGEK